MSRQNFAFVKIVSALVCEIFPGRYFTTRSLGRKFSRAQSSWFEREAQAVRR